jgi:hypothetical protein
MAIYNPANIVITLVVVAAVLAVGVLLVLGLVRWIKRGSSDGAKRD